MLNYILYKIAQTLALALPLRMSYALAVFACDLHYIFADKDRAYTKANLKTIFPKASDKQINRIRMEVFRGFAKYLVDFFRFSIIDEEYIKKHVTVNNRHYIDEAMAKKKGVILLTAHLGNWELGGVVLAQLGYPVWAVALPHKSKKVNNFFNGQRQIKGVKVIQFGKAARLCFKLLKENNMIGLVGDRDFSNEAGFVVELFGKNTYLPKGPAVLSLKTGALILPGFMIRNHDNTFTLHMEKYIEPKSNQTPEELTQEFKSIMEHYIRKYPGQWFMFKKFWIE